jgi:hypothetical protein
MARALVHSVSLEEPNQPEWQRDAYELFVRSAQLDRFGAHTLTSDPVEADIIVFAEVGSHGLFAERVRHHPYVKRFRNKCFIFDSGDYALPLLPGLFASLRKKHFDPARTRTGYWSRIDENPFVDLRPLDANHRYLASFIGSIDTNPVRAGLLKLPSDRFLIEDTSSFALRTIFSGSQEERRRIWARFADGVALAPFALCPRGLGAGSIRLLEAMKMGRVPVILSDEWVYPQRVDWSACSITIPEKDVARIPEILAQYEARAAEMGLNARREWEKYYAPAVRFHWLVEDCLEMLGARRLHEAVASRLAWRHLFNYTNLRLYLSSKKQIYNETGKILL